MSAVPAAPTGQEARPAAEASPGAVSVGAVETVDVAVVGGGITGLSTAWYLQSLDPSLRVVVLEAADRAGGKVGSATMLGRPIDTGPDAFLARVTGAVDLATELGLGDDLVPPGTGQAWLWSDGTLHPLPAGLVLGVPSEPTALSASPILSAAGLAAALRDESADVDLGSPDDLSVAEGIGAHLGREVVERLADPLLGGISAADSNRLSLRSVSPELFAAACAPRLMRHLREHQAASQRGQIGVTETRPVFLTPRRGVHVLVERLTDSLDVRLGTSTTEVRRVDDRWSINTSAGRFDALDVVLATPAHLTASLVSTVAPTLAAELGGWRTSSVALTLLAYRAEDVTLPPGSGLLVPRPEGLLMTAASWWSQKWPHLDVGPYVLIRASAGRDGDDRFVSMRDEQLVAALHGELSAMLDIRAEPVDTHVARWLHGFPLYDVGHGARAERCDRLAAEAGLVLAGASYRGVGIPACIRDARRAAEQVARRRS